MAAHSCSEKQVDFSHYVLVTLSPAALSAGTEQGVGWNAQALLDHTYWDLAAAHCLQLQSTSQGCEANKRVINT